MVTPHLDVIIRLSNSQDTAIRSAAATVLLNLVQNGISDGFQSRNKCNLFLECTRDVIMERDGQNALISLVLVEEPTLQVTASKALARLAEDGKIRN